MSDSTPQLSATNMAEIKDVKPRTWERSTAKNGQRLRETSIQRAREVLAFRPRYLNVFRTFNNAHSIGSIMTASISR